MIGVGTWAEAIGFSALLCSEQLFQKREVIANITVELGELRSGSSLEQREAGQVVCPR